MTCDTRPSFPTTKTTRLKNFFIGPMPAPVVAYFSAISPDVSLANSTGKLASLAQAASSSMLSELMEMATTPLPSLKIVAY